MVAVATARSSGIIAAGVIARLLSLLLLSGCGLEAVTVLRTQSAPDGGVRDGSVDGSQDPIDAGSLRDAREPEDARIGAPDADAPDAECTSETEVFALPNDAARTAPLLEVVGDQFALLRELEMGDAFAYVQYFPAFGSPSEASPLGLSSFGRLFALNELGAAALSGGLDRAGFYRAGMTYDYFAGMDRVVDAATLTTTEDYFTSYDPSTHQHVLHVRRGPVDTDRPLAEVGSSTGTEVRLTSAADTAVLSWVEGVGLRLEPLDSEGTPTAPPISMLECFVISYDLVILAPDVYAVIADCFDETVIGFYSGGMYFSQRVHAGQARIPSRIAIDDDYVLASYWINGEQRPRLRLLDRFFMVVGELQLGVFSGGVPIGMDVAAIRGRPEPTWAIAHTYQLPSETYFVRLRPCP